MSKLPMSHRTKSLVCRPWLPGRIEQLTHTLTVEEGWVHDWQDTTFASWGDEQCPELPSWVRMGAILASDLEGAEIAVVSVNLTSVTAAVLKY
jgi:hypothetical protein